MSADTQGHPDATPPDATAPRTITVEGVYQDGVINIPAPLDIPPGTPVSLQITPTGTARAPRRTPHRRPPRIPAAVPPPIGALVSRADVALLALCLLVYGVTRFIALDRFPIYFFSDEAIQATLAEQLLNNGFRDSTGTWLPPYFLNGGIRNLGLTVYLHAISVALFGKSVLVVRATSAAVTVLGAAAIGLMLKQIFRLRLWWAGILVFAALPAWFLHSRTAFEAVMMVSFYACFLYAYLLYRYRSPRYLVPALVFGAATFYSYSNGQGVMLASGVLLLCSDFAYHRRQSRRVLLVGLALALLLAVPYLRFRLANPDAVGYQLNTLDSYWLRPGSLGDKLVTFGATYVGAFGPGYWFWPNPVDLDRHQMKGMGHLSPVALPFALIGLAVCLQHWRSSAHRAVLIALLAAPFSAALVEILVTRVLAMVVPATLLITLGLEWCYGIARRRVSARVLAIGSAAVLLVLNAWVMRAALVDGPTWYTNYGMYGMQYGAAQVFAASRAVLARSADTQIVMSSSWANNPNVFIQFFIPPADRGRLVLQSIDTLLLRKRELSPSQLYVLPPDEYERARASPKLVVQAPEQIIRYPDGKPGFYFVRIAYTPEADTIFAAEYAARQQPDEAPVTLDGQRVILRYSKLDMGEPGNLFDNDSDTLIRGLEANPLVLELVFPTPRTVRGLRLQTATMNFSLRVEPSDDGASARGSTATYRDLPSDPWVDYPLPDGPAELTRLRLEITELDAPEDVHIHVRELVLY